MKGLFKGVSAVLLAGAVAAPAIARADANSIREVLSRADGAKTVITVRGSATPSFTAYRLEQPARLVVDLAGGKLSDVDGPIDVDTWAVGQIAFAQYSNPTTRTARVMIGLKRAASYDVKAHGNDVVITITPDELPPAAAATAEVDAARKATAAEQSKRAEAEAARARAEADARRAVAARDQALAELARIEQSRKQLDEQLAGARAARARSDEEQAKANAALDAARARSAEAERNRAATQDAESKKIAEEQAAEVKRLEALQAETAKLAKQREAELARLEESQAKAERLASTQEEQLKRLDAVRADAERIAKQRAEEEKRLASVRSALRSSEREAADLARARTVEEKRLEQVRAEADRTSEQRAVEEKRVAELRAEADRAAAKLAQARATEEKRLATARAEAEKRAATLARARDAEQKRLEALQLEADRAARKLAQARDAEEQRLAEEKRLATVRAEANEVAQRREAAQRELAALREQVERAATKLAAAQVEEQKRLERLRTDADSSAEKLERARQAEEQRVESLRAEADRTAQKLATEREAQQQQLAALRAETEKLVREREAEQQRLAATREAVRAEAEQASRAREQSAVGGAKLAEERGAEQQRLAAIRTEEQRLARERDEEQKRLATLRAEEERAARARDDEQRRLAELRNERQKLSSEAAQLSSARAQAVAQLDAARAESKRLAAEQAQLRQERDAQIHQLEQARADAEKVATQRRAELARVERAHAEGARAEAERAAAEKRLADSRAELDRIKVALADARSNRITPPPSAVPASAPSPVAEPPRTSGAHASPVAEPISYTQPSSRGGLIAGAVIHSRSRVMDVDFRDEVDTARVVISIAGDPEYTVLRTGAGNLDGEHETVLRIQSTELPSRLARTLDTSAYHGPVSAVSTYSDPDDPGAVRVVVRLASAVDPAVYREGARIVLDFPKGMARATVTGAYAPVRVAGYGPSIPLQMAPAIPAAQSPPRSVGLGHRRFEGKRIDLDFKDADIHNILRLLADVGDVNIVTSDDVKGTVTIKMHATPWDQALDVILRTKGLGQVREGNLIRVAPQAVLEKEQEAEVARQKVAVELKPLSTRLIPLSYADASKILPRVQDMLSPRGKVSVDERTNQLIVSDIPGNLALAEDLIRNLDTQTPQVQIEARIVEAQSSFLRDIGIQWGGNAIASAATGNPTGIAFPNTIGVAGGNQDQLTRTDGLLNGQAASPNYVVNLPATTGTGLGGVLGMTFGSISGNYNVNLRISAAETQGNLRILSAPKITTLDNVQATIEQGTSIPISTVSAAGTNTVFIDANLRLTVKPHITNEGSIVMYLEILKNEPDFSHTGARGDPTILKKQAKTEMLVRDGDTAVIGGIYTRNSGTNYSKVPWLGDIPVLGWLFKQRRENDNRTELMIFITPRLVNRPAAVAAGR